MFFTTKEHRRIAAVYKETRPYAIRMIARSGIDVSISANKWAGTTFGAEDGNVKLPSFKNHSTVDTLIAIVKMMKEK